MKTSIRLAAPRYLLPALCGLMLMLQGCDLTYPPPAPTPQAPTIAPAPTHTAVPVAQATPTTAQAPSPTASGGDNTIDAEQLFHDSRDTAFRDPVGAVVAGSSVTLRLKTKPGDLTSATVRLWDSRTETESFVPMRATGADMWEATVQTPQEGTALWYRFVAEDGTKKGYYNDDRDRDGGKGEGKLFESDTDYVITAYDPRFETPAWVREGVVYQIFPDRFNNGDPSNDKPAGSFIYGGQTKSHQWGDPPTGGDDFFGGDLKGVADKLDYLQSLGVTAIYFNPIFVSPSNHRYDTTDFTRIDPSLGDLAAFQDLVGKAKDKGIHIILDGVFNHSSSDSLYFDKFSRYDTTGAYESQESPYASWYKFTQFPAKYRSWQNYDTLPQFTETGEVKRFLFEGQDSIVARWMKEGIGGWRLDAAEQKSHDFWRDLRPAVKALDPDAVIVGEFWQNSAPWLAGDQWDGTMNYRFRDALLGWFTNPGRNAEMLAEQLDSIREDYPPQALAASMNLIGSHDTRRALTEAGNNKALLKMMAVMQFTWPGMPTIYYGDEAGLIGGRDPDDRRTFPWGSEDTALVDFYKMLASVRRDTSSLRTGDYLNLGFDNKLDYYAYARKDDASAAIVALTRSTKEVPVELSVAGVVADGTTLVDKLNNDAEYAVSGGKLKLTLKPQWGVLLVPKR